jgi:hypothetical protein
MYGSLSIFRTDTFNPENLRHFLEVAMDYENPRLLISDGIMLNIGSLRRDLRIQRILTSNQLQKILLDMDNSPCYILLSSNVVGTWKKIIVESIYDIIKGKSYHGSIIFMNIIGKAGIFELYFGKRVISGEALKLWAEHYRQ